MKKKTLALWLISVVILGMLTGCSSPDNSSADSQTQPVEAGIDSNTQPEETQTSGVDATEEKTYRFAFFTNTLNNTFQIAMSDVYEQACKEKGYEYVCYDSDYDASMQISQLEDAANKGFDAIFLIPADSQSIRQGVEAVYNAGIPIFNVDTPVADLDMVVTTIATDAYQAGFVLGEQMVADYPDGGDIAILEHPENESAVQRVTGFLDGLGTAVDNYNIVARQNCGSALDQSLTITEDIVQANPDLMAIFCVNGTSGMGSIAALKEKGLDGQVGVYCIDASPDNKAAMVEGALTGVAAQCPMVIAATSFENALNHLNGQEIEKEILIPSYSLTLEQAEATVDVWQ